MLEFLNHLTNVVGILMSIGNDEIVQHCYLDEESSDSIGTPIMVSHKNLTWPCAKFYTFISLCTHFRLGQVLLCIGDAYRDINFTYMYWKHHNFVEH